MSESMEQSQVAPDAAAASVGSGLVEQMLDAGGIAPEHRSEYRGQIEMVLKELLGTATAAGKLPKIDRKAIDMFIVECDRKIGAQLDEILHHPEFQRLEAAWRGLKFLVDRTDFRENIRIDLLSLTKEELAEDFEDAPETVRSGLYKQVYTPAIGQFGGDPYGAIVADYAFNPSSKEVALLASVAEVAAMAHAPFIAGAGPELVGCNSFTELGKLGDLQDVVTPDRPEYAKWFGFRRTENARYVGLAMPRVLLRDPHSPENARDLGFDYTERVEGDHDRYLWGNASFAFATRLTDSFAKYRWCANVIGPDAGGTVKDLKVHTFQSGGQTAMKCPTEVQLPLRRDFELSDQSGLLPLNHRDKADEAVFFAAPSVRQPKRFANTAEGNADSTNELLGCQLPYMFIVSRLAHYVKAIQIENLGRGYTQAQFQSDLQKWIDQYVSRNPDPDQRLMATKPLKEARVEVEADPAAPGWFRVEIRVTPHFKYQGAHFELSLVGKLEQDSK
jgi:type VI secretion system protein ImpC